MRKRRKSKTVSGSQAQVLENLREQLSQALTIMEKQQREIERLQQMNTELRERVEALERTGKRQAAPFARRHWVENPRRPGRTYGQGKFVRRELPQVHQVQETKIAPLRGCPECGGQLRDIHPHEQFVTDIPVVEVKTTRFVTYSGYCGQCRKRVRSRHPQQTSQATGAAGVMIGPRAKALAADLKHRLGVSYARSVK